MRARTMCVTAVIGVGADTVNGGLGAAHSRLVGGPGNDHIHTGSGNEVDERARDVFRCGRGFDVVTSWYHVDELDRLVDCERVRFFPHG